MKNIPPPKNILVADDHAFIRRVAMESLTALDNVIVTEVENGTNALHALGLQSTERLPADNSIPSRAFMKISPRNLTCLVTDFNMPHANGLQILRLIRMGLTGVPRDFPVVMLTGYNEDRMVAAAIQLDVNGFVIKPVAKSALQNRTVQALKQRIIPRDIDHYARVEIPQSRIEEEQATRPEDTEQTTQERMALLAQLRPGDCLCQDIISHSGQVLLYQGTELSEALIKRLREIAEITGIRKVCAHPAQQSA